MNSCMRCSTRLNAVALAVPVVQLTVPVLLQVIVENQFAGIGSPAVREHWPT